MPLTPADVHNVAFKKPPIGKRGYDEDEVDAFLDLVEAEFARLIEENSELRSRADDAGDRPTVSTEETGPVAMDGPPPSPVLRKPEPEQAPGDTDQLTQATRMLALATETADRHVGEAKSQADRLLTEARTSSEQMVAEAKTKSEQQLNEARTKSEAMTADAKTRSDTMDRESRTRAQALTQDAERKHVEIMGSLEERKSSLEKQIEELRTFEREYRTRLKSYLESQLRDLDGRNSAEPSGQQRPAGVGQAQNSANQPQG
ncbi:MAG: DivIVA-like cell division protein Wag31 [Geodermatophilaceae bacterium]